MNTTNFSGSAALRQSVPEAAWQEIMEQSRAARWGSRALLLGEAGLAGATLFQPVLVLLALVLANSVNAVAQGPIITPSSGQFGQTIVKFVRILFALIFIAGFVFMARAVYSYFQKDGFAYDLGGAGLCWGINIVTYLIYAVSRGDTIEIDPGSLGGN